MTNTNIEPWLPRKPLLRAIAGAVVAVFATMFDVYMPANNASMPPEIGKLSIGNRTSEIGNWKLLFFAFCAVGLEEFGEDLAALIGHDVGVDFDGVVQSGIVAEIV